nr:PREDICTED: cathepsin B-like cysteine proteinase 4 isoform X1 [Bemisia tabaci]
MIHSREVFIGYTVLRPPIYLWKLFKAITLLGMFTLLASTPVSAREVMSVDPETLSLKNQDAMIDYINRVQSSWTAGKNFPDGVPESYLKQLAVAHRKSEEDLSRSPVWNESEDKVEEPYSGADPPAEFDARKKWSNCASISHIYDQGNCGSCWAVCSAAVITDRICITTNGAFKDTISAWDIASCCVENKCGEGCNGGSPFKAFEHYVKIGLVTGGDFGTNKGCMPYEIKGCSHHMGKNGKYPDCHSYNETVVPKCLTKCPNTNYKIAFTKDKHFGKRVYTVKPADLKKELFTLGPVVMAFEVFEDFYLYKTGIYHHTTGKSMGWHAVRIVGYGNGYWLATNSWNPEWGDHGTFRIKSFANECSSEEEGFDATEPKIS